MNKNLSIFLICVIIVTVSFSCSLVGDIEAQRPKPEENSDPGISTPEEPTLPSPGAPVVTALDGILTVRWTAVEEAENYEVYAGTALVPPTLPMKTVSVTTTVLDGLVNKTTYYVWIKAVNQTNFSDFSSRGFGIPWPSNEVPAAPGRPVIIPGINQLTINWEESGGAASYEVYINTTTIRPPLPEAATGKTSAVINDLENSIIYYMWVRAVNGAGKSDYSPLEAGTPTIPTVAPVTPGRPVLAAGSRELAVSWQAVELASAYEIWLGTSDDSALAEKQGSDIADTQSIITGLVNETIYHVWVKAKNVADTSGFSLSASAKPSAFLVVPETPAMPTAVAGFNALDVSWPPVEGALFYELWIDISNNPANAEKYGVDVADTSVTLTGIENGTTYFIWIKAKNNIGEGEFSPYASGTPSVFAIPPSTPQTAPTVINGSGRLTVSWQPVEGASLYEVWAGTENNPEESTKRGDDVSGLSAVISGLENDTTYYIWIKAKNDKGTSGFSPAASGTPSIFAVIPQTPAAPAVTIGNGQISVTWQAMEGAEAYEVWVSMENNSGTASKYGSDITDSLSAAISGLNNGTMYYIWLKANNAAGTSGFSPVVNGKPMAGTVVPSLTAGNAKIDVSWTTIAGADQYEVFYGTGENPPQAASQTINAPATSATITGLVNGTSYNVWIRGKNSTATGAMGNPANAKPIGIMGTVTLASGNSQLSVSWPAVAGADQYEVFFDTASTIPASPTQTVSTTAATIDSLVNGTIYYVWVRGKNPNGVSNTSTVVSGKPLGTPGLPTITSGYRQLEVTWVAVAGADEYELYYGIGTPTTLWATTTGTTATITGLTGGTTYHIRLRAKNTDGISDFGPTTSAAPGSELSPGLYRGGVKIGSQNLSASLSFITVNAVSGDKYIIVLGANESVSPSTLSYSGKTVEITLMGSGGERTVTLNANGSMFTVTAGVSLTLDENITLVGRSANNASLVRVDGGNLIMNEGAKVSENNAGASRGAGISLLNGTFSMNGGIVNKNTSIYGGGGICIENGIFTMYDGTISGNNASNSGSYAYGGGVYVLNGIFIMHGGIIYGNTAYAPYAWGGGIYGTFKKLSLDGDSQNSGIIYGSDAVGIDGDGIPLKNTARDSGHAVYSTAPTRVRNTTAGQTDHIDTTTGLGLSASGNPPYGQ